MYPIAETSMLVRSTIGLPAGLKPATLEFCEGWNFVGGDDAQLFEHKILGRGWKFTGIADGLVRSGVGETSQAAAIKALNLALRQMEPNFNAVGVNRIEWTQYPWFFLARVTVNPYRIHDDARMPELDERAPLKTTLRPKRLPLDSAALFPHFGSEMPLLREILVLSRSPQARIQ